MTTATLFANPKTKLLNPARSLREYRKIAHEALWTLKHRRIISFGVFCEMRGNDEAFSHVLEHVVYADMTFDVSRGRGKHARRNFMIRYARYAMLSWYKRKRNDMVQFSQLGEDFDIASAETKEPLMSPEVWDLPALTDNEKIRLKQYYIEGMSYEEIGPTKQAAEQMIRRAESKIHEYVSRQDW